VKETSWRVSADTPEAGRLIAAVLMGMLRMDRSARPLVLCIGSDRSTGDALGPLVGSILARRPERAYHVLGTLDCPVHAMNLLSVRQSIAAHQPVIAVDASLGIPEQVGTVTVGIGPLRPGAGVRKQLPSVGDFHVTGTVNVGGFMEYLVLQNTRLYVVMKLATVIAQGIHLALQRTPSSDDQAVISARQPAVEPLEPPLPHFAPWQL